MNTTREKIEIMEAYERGNQFIHTKKHQTTMRYKIFTLFAALTLSAGALFASDTAVDGIYYDFDDAKLTTTVTYRGSSLYEYTNEYTGDVVIPATVTYGGKSYSVTSIGDYAFYGCSGLTSVTIPISVTSIRQGAFAGCSGLTSVVWNAKNCTDCYLAPFDNISQITSFTFGSEVEHIPAYLCYGMENLTSVTIPNSVTSIHGSAFSGCSGLTSVIIGNSVTSIGDWAFEYCSGLTSVTIGNSVTSIGDRAFYDCSSLTSVVWNAKNFADFQWYYNNGNSYSDAPFYYIASQITSFTFGSEVEHIPAYLCYRMKNLTSVTIPNSVTSIGSGAFEYCSGLTSVTIPNSVTSIGNHAFEECTQLTNIVCYAAEPPSCDASSFANYDASLKVPCSSLEAYKAAAVWSSFKNISCIGLEQIELADLYTQAGRIVCDGEFRIYDLLGRDVTRLNGSLSGVYVVKTANAAVKVVVK